MSDKQLRAKVTVDSDVDGLKKISVESLDAEKSIRQLNKASEDTSRTMREASSANDVLTRDFQTLRLMAADAEEQIRSLNRRLQSADPNSAEYKQLANSLEYAGGEAQYLSTAFDKFNKELAENKSLSDDQRRMLQLLSDELADTHQFLKSTDKALDSLNDNLDEFGDEIKRAGQSTAQTGEEIHQVRSEMQVLEDAIANTSEVWRMHNRGTIALKKTYKEWREEGRRTAEELEALGDRIQQAQLKEMALITETRELVKVHNSLNNVVDNTSGQYGKLSLELNHAEGWINGMNNAVRRQHKDMRDLAGNIDEVGEAVKRFGAKEILLAATTAMFNKMMDAASDAGRAVVQFFKDSQTSFSEFDTGVRQVMTMVDDFSASMKDELRVEVRELGKEIGRLPEEYLPALYQALSLGIPEENALEAVKESSIAARASNADLTRTLVTGQSIVNAYGAEMYSLNRVYDLLFYAVKNGAVTIDDLNSGMNEITSVAGEANVRLEDVVAAIIVMTKQGDSFGEAAGLMSNMLTQLQVEGTAMGGAFKKAAGVDFREFIAQGGNLAQALQLIEQHAINTGTSMVQMLGGESPFYRDQQAMRGALELTGKHMEEFIAISQDATISSGAVATAYAEVADSMGVAEANTKATTEALKVQLGEAMEPSTRAWLEFKIAVAEGSGALLMAYNDDNGRAVTRMIEQNREAAQSQIQLKELALELAAAYNQSLLLGIFDVTGAAGELKQGLYDIILTQIELSDSNETFKDQQDAVYNSLKAVYGQAVTLEGGYIKLNGETVAQATHLYELAEAQEAERIQTYYSILAQQRQADALERSNAAIARQAAEAAAADQVLAKYGQQAEDVGQQAEDAGQKVENLHNVLEVLDGDTVRIELEGEIKDVRFRNINAPEIQHGDEAAMPWAYAAMNTAQDYFDENPLNLQGQMDRESYGRIIAAVPDLERKLVAQGMAIPLPVHMTEDPATFDQLKKIVQRAAAAGIGMFEDQALATRILNGEMVDLGKYYEELAEHQTRLTGHFEDATGPVTTLFDAYQRLSDAPAWGIDEAKAAVISGNEAIVASYQQTAYEIYLTQNGVTEGTIAMGVAMGIFTEQEGLARLEFANTQTAIEELILSQQNLKLSDEELIIATQLLIDGLAKTPAEAAKAAKGMDGLSASAATARDRVRETHDALINAQGDYAATFTTTNKTINKTENHPPTGPGGSAPPYTPPATPAYTGGRLQANAPYIVGDAPGGRLTPYSELFIPDQSGYLLDAQTTAALLGNSGKSRTEVSPASAGGNTTYIFQITIEGDRSDVDHVTFAARTGVLQAAEQIGLRL